MRKLFDDIRLVANQESYYKFLYATHMQWRVKRLIVKALAKEVGNPLQTKFMTADGFVMNPYSVVSEGSVLDLEEQESVQDLIDSYQKVTELGQELECGIRRCFSLCQTNNEANYVISGMFGEEISVLSDVVSQEVIDQCQKETYRDIAREIGLTLFLLGGTL